MIMVICGKPRGGKSLYAVMQLCYELRNTQRFIVTNLPLDLEQVAEWAGKYGISATEVRRRVRLLSDAETSRFWLFDPEGMITEAVTVKVGDIYQKCKWESRGREAEQVVMPDFSSRQHPSYPGVAAFIDEAHIHFGARATLKRSDELTFFLSQHGHLRYDVWFISQHPAKLDKHIRVDAQDWTVVSNLGNVKGWLGVSLPRVFRRATYQNVPGSSQFEKPMETGTFRLNVSEYGVLYSTSAGVGLAGRVDTQETQRGNHWSRWVGGGLGIAAVVALVPLLCLKVLGMGIHGGLKSFMDTATGPVSNVVAVAAAPVQPPAVTNRPSAIHPLYPIRPSPDDHKERNSYGTRLQAATVFLTGISPVGLILDDGSIMASSEGYRWARVPGGVLVNGQEFIPWSPKLKRKEEAAPGGDGRRGVRVAAQAEPRRYGQEVFPQ